MDRRIPIVLVTVVALAAIAAVYSSRQPTGPGEYDEFAQCLTEKGVTMYGAYWCPHCKNQKKMFGSSFQYVNNVECDPRGDNAQPQLCSEAEIKGYPTWIYNGERKEGELGLKVLSAWTDCPLS